MCGRLSHLALRGMSGPQKLKDGPLAGLVMGLGVRMRAVAAIARGLQAALVAIQRGCNRHDRQYGSARVIW